MDGSSVIVEDSGSHNRDLGHLAIWQFLNFEDIILPVAAMRIRTAVVRKGMYS